MCCIYGVILCVTFFGLMGPGINKLNMGRQAASDIFETIERKPEIDPNEGQILDSSLHKQFQGDIVWQNVKFAYPSRPKNPIFTNINLKIQHGTSLALCGPSGSGKSTIARLLLRFYNPDGGRISVDGFNLEEIRPSWWRDQVGYVSQEPMLFPGTIRENIAVGKPGGASDDEVYEAAKAACAHDFIMELPDGYDTYYSGTAMPLSGGQLQRISIARAVVKKPSVLLLDEATSALDSASEQHVVRAIASVRRVRKMTTISVAHRLSTIIGADQIAVISNGEIAEIGNHATLLKKDGIYAALCGSQGITAESKGLDADVVDSTPETTKADGNPNSDVEKSVLEASKPESALIDEEEEPPEVERLAPMSRLWKYTAADTGYTLIGLLGAAITGALSPAESILTANIVANFYVEKPDDMLDANRPYILAFLIFACASIVGSTISGIGLSVSGYRLTRRMRQLAFGSIVR